MTYWSSKNNASANMLSQFPMGKPSIEDEYNHYIYQSVVEDLPVTSEEIKLATSTDPILSKVLEYTLFGWPKYLRDRGSNHLALYFIRRHELSVDDDCILWGRRVIIPEECKQRVLTELHECHPGINRMKSLARSYVWWPGQTADIEDLVKTCTECTDAQNTVKMVPLLLWPMATEHIDFLEIKGQMFVIFIDGYSKWPEVIPMQSTTAQATITVCKSLFARYGLPSRIVTDNGPQFIAYQFNRCTDLQVNVQEILKRFTASRKGL